MASQGSTLGEQEAAVMASFGDRLFCGFDHEICWARDYNELLCSIVIEKHIMYDCDRKCVVHLTQFSVF